MLNIAAQTEKIKETVAIFGVPVTNCTFRVGVNLIEEIIARKKPQLVVLANANTLNIAYERSSYKKVLKGAGLVLRDGSGVGWAFKKKEVDPLHNFVGTNFIPDFCKFAGEKGYRIYLIGSRPGVTDIAAKKSKSMFPNIDIVGNYHGYFPEEQTDEIIDQINKTQPDILLVAMGNPKQEFWIANNIHKLNVPVCIGVGALFDYISGRVARAPQWMLNMGIEWIFRLVIEPKRLWKRYLIGNVKFVLRVYKENISQKFKFH